MKRYSWSTDFMEWWDDGDYVLFSDYEAEVARLRAEVEVLRSFVSDYISAFRNGFDGDDHLLNLAKSLLSRETGDPDVE